jgi:hypothetical protein
VFLGGTRIDANQIASIHRKSVKNLSMPKCPQGSRLWRSTRDTALTASRLFGVYLSPIHRPRKVLWF